MKQKIHHLTKLFFRGLVIIAPIAITAYSLYYIFIAVDGIIPGLRLPRGVGFFLVLFIVIFIGYLGSRFFFGRWLVDEIGSLLERTPGIKVIYSSVKDVMDSFMGDQRKFTKPVWVKVSEQPETWRIGFITQEQIKDSLSEDMVAVYLPHAYAISGWVIVVSKNQTKPVSNMNAVEAMKFAVSGGVSGSVEK